MVRKNITRVLLSVLLIAAVMVSISAAAFADDAGFVFELPKDFEVKDVIIMSEKSGANSVLERAPWLFEQYTGAEVAEYVAYDRYLKGESYAYELDEENGFVIFGITGPTTILVPSKIVIPEEGNLDMTVLCIDIPDGTELDIHYTDGNYSGNVKVPVKDGVARFTIYGDELEKMKNSDDLEVTIDYTVDGEDYSDTAKYPIDDGSDDNGGNGNGNGNSGNGNGGNGGSGDNGGNGDSGNGDGKDSDIKHGIVAVGSGYEAGAKVDDNKIFNKVEPVWGHNDGEPELQIWYNGDSINIPLDPEFYINLFK